MKMKKLFFIVSLFSFAAVLAAPEYKVPTYRLPQDIVDLLNKTTGLTGAEYNTLAKFFDSELNRNRFMPTANVTVTEEQTLEQARESGLAQRNFEMHFEPLFWKIFNKINDEKSLRDLPAAEYNFFITLLTGGVGLLHEQKPKEEGGRSKNVMRLLHENILKKIEDNQSLQQTTRGERTMLMGLLMAAQLPGYPEEVKQLAQKVLPIIENNKNQLVDELPTWNFYFNESKK